MITDETRYAFLVALNRAQTLHPSIEPIHRKFAEGFLPNRENNREWYSLWYNFKIDKRYSTGVINVTKDGDIIPNIKKYTGEQTI